MLLKRCFLFCTILLFPLAVFVPTAQTQEESTVEFWGWWNEEDISPIWAGFEEEFGYEIVYVHNPDFETALRASLASGEPPDVVLRPDPWNVAEYVHADVMEPITDYVHQEDYDPEWLSAGTVVLGDLSNFSEDDLILYGLPLNAGIFSVFGYLEEDLESAGLEIPSTYEEFLEVSQQINLAPVVNNDGFNPTDTGSVHDILISLYGSDAQEGLATRDTEWTNAWNSEETLHAWNVYPEFIENGFGFVDVTDEHQFFAMPGAGGPMPQRVWTTLISVLREGSNVAGGLAFIEYLSRPDVAQLWASLGLGLSPNNAVSPEDYEDSYLQAMATILNEAPGISHEVSGLLPIEIRSLEDELFSSYMAGELTAQEALDEMQSAYDSFYSEEGAFHAPVGESTIVNVALAPPGDALNSDRLAVDSCRWYWFTWNGTRYCFMWCP